MPANKPLVSIVLPTRNGHRYIRDSIASCLGQTYDHFELIVVDGGSTDGTLDTVRSFEDPRIRIIHQPANSGKLPGALNLGFAAAQGEYFTWTQDDDLLAPEAIAVMVDALNKDPDVGLVYAGYWWIDEEGRVIREGDRHPPEAIYWTNPVGHPFMYRRCVADRVGLYDVDYFMAEDFHYWTRIYQRYPMRQIPKRVYYHRRQSGSLTFSDYGAYYALRLAARARRHVLGISPREYRRQVARGYIEEAFARYAKHDWNGARTCLVKGVLNDPGWLRNRGVVSMGVETIVSQRVMLSIRRGRTQRA